MDFLDDGPLEDGPLTAEERHQHQQRQQGVDHQHPLYGHPLRECRIGFRPIFLGGTNCEGTEKVEAREFRREMVRGRRNRKDSCACLPRIKRRGRFGQAGSQSGLGRIWALFLGLWAVPGLGFLSGLLTKWAKYGPVYGQSQSSGAHWYHKMGWVWDVFWGLWMDSVANVGHVWYYSLGK